MIRPRDYQPGDTVPGTVYRVVRLIGAGGMGTVYDVEDTTVGKRYVLKTLHPELHKRDDLAVRMMKEARQLARLQHPNIVEVVTAGVTADDIKLPYYVMEKLNGQSLHTVLNKKGSLELPHALHIAIDLLDALDNAHEKGVIHRDVKPDNIFLHINPNGLTTTKLLDFGIMKVLDEPGLTAGRFMGTLRYASPEQLRGETPMPQTDLYAAGLVLYEMVAGKGPFDDEGDSNKIAAAHLSATPPPLLHWGVVVPEVLERLIRGALSKDPLKRPKDAFTFASQLRNMNRALAAERPSNVTSRPTEVPVVSPGSDDSTSTPATRKVSPAGQPAMEGVASAAALAATEHAATRAGTPDAKSPVVPSLPGATGGSETATAVQTVMGMTAPPSTGPTLMDPPRTLESAGETSRTGAEPGTERGPAAIDRRAATHSATGPAFPSPRGDGSTEPMPVVSGVPGGTPSVGAGAWRAPGTLRMSSAPQKPGADDASELLARLPVREAPVAATDGAASSTVSPRTGSRMRPVVAVAVGLVLTAAMASTVWLIVGGIRSRLSTAEPPVAAAVQTPTPPMANPPVANPPVAAPTLPVPLDLPPPVASASSAPASPAAPSASPAEVAPESPPPVHSRPGSAPRTAPSPTPAPSTSPPLPPPAKHRLPGSGL